MEDEKVIQPAIHPAEGPLLMGEEEHGGKATHGDAVLVNDVGQNQMFSAWILQVQQETFYRDERRSGTMGSWSACCGRRNVRSS